MGIDCGVTFQMYGSFYRALPTCRGNPCHEPRMESPRAWTHSALIGCAFPLLPAEGLSVFQGSVSHQVLNILSQPMSLALGRLPSASCLLRACSMLPDSRFRNDKHETNACKTQLR